MPPDDEEPLAPGRFQSRTIACDHLQEADAHAGPAPQAEHVKTGAAPQVYPCLLRKLAVTRPNNPVWAMDITCIPMARGFIDLDAVLHWLSRKVLFWRRSTMLGTGRCIEALKDAMRNHAKPEIVNADQGSQLTSIDFIKALRNAAIQISMDGKGVRRDKVFVGRLRRTIKSEEVYLPACDSVSAVRESLDRYLTFDNSRRPHSPPGGKTPAQACLNPLPSISQAA